MKDQGNPKVIWLEPSCVMDCADATDRMWCQDDVWGECEDCGTPPQKYIRADIAEAAGYKRGVEDAKKIANTHMERAWLTLAYSTTVSIRNCISSLLNTPEEAIMQDAANPALSLCAALIRAKMETEDAKPQYTESDIEITDGPAW